MKNNYLASFLFLSLAAFFLWLAVAQRLGATCLEDDLLWFIPSLENILHTHSFWGALKAFNFTPEMPLFDDVYFSFFIIFIGHHFPVYAYASFILHFLNTVAFFIMLFLGLRFSQGSSLLASLIFLTFYGHYHAYLWPMAVHHQMVLLLSFVMMTLYLVADRHLDENKNIGKIYGWMMVLAVFAGFNRLSILVLPLMMVSHMALTNETALKLLDKIHRWLPVFYLLTLYQVADIFCGEKEDVLSKILHYHARQWTGPAALLIAAGWALVIMGLFAATRLALKGAITNKLYFLHRPWYVLLFFSYPLCLCCYAWFAPMASLTSRGVFERWQPMALPGGILAHTGWLVLGTFLIFYFIRVAVLKRDLLIFLVWYLFLIPYLSGYGQDIPSRYLVYVSPILAVSLALFWQRIKWKWVKTAAAAGLVVLMASNVWAIHARSLRSWTTDYRWSYDFVKYAHFIKEDLVRKGINPSDASICVRNVVPIPYLDRWQKVFLSKNFDGYSPLIDITESVLGTGRPRSFKINKPCAPADQSFDALVMDSSKVKILDRDFDGNGLALYSQDYDSDLKVLQNDRLIYQDSVFKRPLDFAQGHLIGAYKGFSIFYFGKYYFTTRSKHFNLIQFKTNSYVPSHASKTLWEARQWVDEGLGTFTDTGMGPMVPIGLPKDPMASSYNFKLSCWAIPIGHWQWQMGQEYFDHNMHAYSIFSLKPWAWLTHQYGYAYYTVLDRKFLPVQSQEGSLDKFKKNDVQTIFYDHERGFMLRRGYKEDIFSDTRDLAGLLTWALKQNYRQAGIWGSTFHEGRNLYQCEIIPVKSIRDETFVDIHIAHVLGDLTKRPWASLEAVLIHRGDVDLPLRLILKLGFLHIPIDFNLIA